MGRQPANVLASKHRQGEDGIQKGQFEFYYRGAGFRGFGARCGLRGRVKLVYNDDDDVFHLFLRNTQHDRGHVNLFHFM